MIFQTILVPQLLPISGQGSGFLNPFLFFLSTIGLLVVLLLLFGLLTYLYYWISDWF